MSRTGSGYPVIETERLLLRRPDPARDFDAWARAMADESTVRYLGTPTMSRPQAWRNLAMVLGHWEIRGFGFFSLEDKATGQWLGRIGPWYPEGWPAPEVGWTLSPEHRGKGYATEAGRASIRFAFERLGWSEVIHVILPGNQASMALARRLGSELQAEQNGLPGVTGERVLIFGQRATPPGSVG